MLPKRVQLKQQLNQRSNQQNNNIKNSIYDWDSPSSYTGTVKRRPSSQETNIISGSSNTSSSEDSTNTISSSPTSPSSSSSSGNECLPHDQPKVQKCNNKNIKKISRKQLPQANNTGNSSYLKKKIDENKQIQKNKSIMSLTSNEQHKYASSSKSKLKTLPQKSVEKNSQSSNKFLKNPNQNQNQNLKSIKTKQEEIQFTELFCDFPEAYDTTDLIGSFSKNLPPPKPPTPPPICDIPKNLSPNKKLHKTNSDEHPSDKSDSKRGSPLKTGRCVSELKSCLSKINSRSIFSSLTSLTSSQSQNSNNSPADKDPDLKDELQNTNDYIFFNLISSSTSRNPNTKISPDDMLLKPEFNSIALKNIPVRQRKGGIPHLDNYCLFDPSVDFINEKDANKQKIHCNLTEPYQTINLSQESDGQSLDWSIGKYMNEELIEEIIYDDGQEGISLKLVEGDVLNNHNYFTIDPEDFEDEQQERIEASSEMFRDNEAGNIAGFESSLRQSMSLENVIEKKLNLNLNTSLPKRRRPLNLLMCSNSLKSMRNRKNFDLCQYRNRTIPIESNYMLFNSRNNKYAPYKIRKPRPISTHSDADSGFLSPNSPDELKFNPALLVLEQCDSIQGYIEIYTDWANYYLERAKSKKKVTDLSLDCRDGLLLADVIEAVTTFKVPDLIKKPKTQQQMFDNVNSCLNLLRHHSINGLDTITPNDICSGRLKAVLALFFALSRYKQKSKLQQQQQHKNNLQVTAKIETTTNLLQQQQQGKYLGTLVSNTLQQQQQQQQQHGSNINQNSNSNANIVAMHNGNPETMMTNRQIPVPYSKTNGGTAIPIPATVLVQRRCPPDKVRPLPPTPNHVPSIPGLGKTGGTNGVELINGRPDSPPNSNHTIQLTQKSNNANNNGLRQPQSKIPPNPYNSPVHQSNGSSPQHQGSALPPPAVTIAPTKHSMLDKLKLFNKEKSASSTKSSQISKRTSSSSGFSSARSERSDSSLSLNDGTSSQIKPPQTGSIAITANRIVQKDSSAKAANLKQSKLFSKVGSKDTLTKKDIKKEKSPARDSNDIKSKAQKSSNNNLKIIEQKAKSSSKQSLNSTKSESKTSLIIPPSKTALVPVNNGTGIPKPMAAIKGTSKAVNLTEKPSLNKEKTSDDLKTEKCISKENISMEIDFNQQLLQQQQQLQQKTTHIVNPTLNTGLSNILNNNISQLKEPPVIYRAHQMNLEQNPEYIANCNLMTSGMKNSITNFNRKLDFHNPLNSGRTKFNTVPTKIVGTIYEEEKPVSVQPMRPLLRGYNSHVTLPTRGSRNGQNFVADFCESDIGQGYMSDGDALRRIPQQRYNNDIDNGYLSEGSGGIHHGKHFLSIMRARSQLPTTIEERIRGSGGSLDSIGPASIESQQTTVSNPNTKMDINGTIPNANSSNAINSNSRSSSRSNLTVTSSGNGSITRGIDWQKSSDQMNAQHQQQLQNQQLQAQQPHQQQHASPTRKDKSPGHSRRSSSSSKQSSSGRTKGVPQSFGYVKRSNGSATGQITATDHQNILLLGQQQQQLHQQQLQQQQLQQQHQGRTAHVSAVPRTGKIKVSGGTQTCSNDLQNKIPPNAQHRSFSLTGPGATQLSQSIRERLSNGSHSLPKPGTDMHIFQHRIINRNSAGKILDGSLSDTQTYAEVKPEYSTYAMWLKHSNTAASRLSEGDSIENIQIGSPGMQRHHTSINQKLIHRGGDTTAFIQSPRLNRSNSIRSTKSEKMYPSMLSRGPDVEIEPYYCLPVGTITHQANGQQTVAWSQPTSPTPPHHIRGFGGTLSPTHPGSILTTGHRLTYPKKNDEVHGSAASLLSGGSSLYGSAEERQAHEVRRLKRELADAREQVNSLSSQLSTNAHVVAAFEQSLSTMTNRLQHLTATAERKDSELTDMRQTIELLRKQSIQAGLTTAHMQSMGVQQANVNTNNNKNSAQLPPTSIVAGNNNDNGIGDRQKLVNDLNKTIQIIPASPKTINGQQHQSNLPISMQRHHSSDSMCSLNSISSGCSAQDKKKKKGWLRSSFTKAFSRNAKIAKTNRHIGIHNNSGSSTNNADSSLNSTILNSTQLSNVSELNNSNAASLPPPSPTKSLQKNVTLIENAKPVDAIELEGNPVVEDLKKQLREKDLVLTDIRLEALSSASQLESLKDTVMKMRAEMLSLKQNNERLQKLVTSRSLAGSQTSLGNAVSPNGSIGDSRRYSLADGNTRPPMELPKSLEEEVEEENIPPAPAPEPPPPPLSPTTHIDLTPPPPAIEAPSPTHLTNVVEDIPDPTDGKKISIAVYLGQPESFGKYLEEIYENDNFYAKNSNANESVLEKEENQNGFEDRKFPNLTLNEFIIAYTYISGKTSWQNLDYIVRKTFKDYVSRIDPGTNLGLNTDSITSYHLGEAKRGPEIGFPELLPCGYIIGNVKTLYICLQGVGSLAFDSLIPRSIVHRYISLLTEHRRLILCGPSGTGKSYLARKLAEFLVARIGRINPSEAIATFNVDHKSSKELRQYLGHIAEQASIANGASELPSVIILDNLHHASALGDVFSCLLSAGPAAKLPCIIGTMSQATCNTTNLQLHHNFRWVLTANHMEPVKGFLGRFLRRRLFSLELQTQNHSPELTAVLAWLPTVWQHINRFLENHSSSDVTIGPRLFLSCPLDLKDSQVWFTDVWNYHLAPYLVEAVREGVQLYGRRGGAWNDPSTFIRDTYPWSYGPDSVPPLRQINAEDVGLEGGITGNNDSQDPLLNMLMRLQEAANYSGNQEEQEESDCASLDSNITPDSSAGAE